MSLNLFEFDFDDLNCDFKVSNFNPNVSSYRICAKYIRIS